MPAPLQGQGTSPLPLSQTPASNQSVGAPVATSQFPPPVFSSSGSGAASLPPAITSANVSASATLPLSSAPPATNLPPLPQPGATIAPPTAVIPPSLSSTGNSATPASPSTATGAASQTGVAFTFASGASSPSTTVAPTPVSQAGSGEPISSNFDLRQLAYLQGVLKLCLVQRGALETTSWLERQSIESTYPRYKKISWTKQALQLEEKVYEAFLGRNATFGDLHSEVRETVKDIPSSGSAFAATLNILTELYDNSTPSMTAEIRTSLGDKLNLRLELAGIVTDNGVYKMATDNFKLPAQEDDFKDEALSFISNALIARCDR